jgi:hypothetical protein
MLTIDLDGNVTGPAVPVPVSAQAHVTSYFSQGARSGDDQGLGHDVLPFDLSLVARDHSGASMPRMRVGGTIVPRLSNALAQEGLDRCICGCKYWENDQCIDCGLHVSVALDYAREVTA